MARRQTHFSYDAETTVSFTPLDERQFAGLTAYYCRFNFFYLAVSAHADGKREVLIMRSEASWQDGRLTYPMLDPVEITTEGKVRLEFSLPGKALQF